MWKEKPYRLDADYLIFGYAMNADGDITVKKVWMHKIWQIAGTSQRFPLKTQVKRDYHYSDNLAFDYYSLWAYASHNLLATAFTTGTTTVLPKRSNAFAKPVPSSLNIDKL